MRALLASVLLAGASSCIAAYGQCPVTVVQLRHSALLHQVRIAYQNSSQKPITAVKFSVYFVDGVGDAHQDPLNYISDRRVKPGKMAAETWQEYLHENVKLKAELIKVMYADGMTWTPPDGQTCYWFNR